MSGCGDPTRRVREFALAMGASLLGVAPAKSYPEYVQEITRRIGSLGLRVEDYLLPAGERPFYESMSNPHDTLQSARSVILIGAYAFDDGTDYRSASRELRGKIARTYAYYPVVRKISESTAAFIQSEVGYDAVACQAIPLKLVAVRLGLGSYGESGLLLTRRWGTYVALGAVLTTAPLSPDALPTEDLCQHCGACRKACPTGALYEAGRVNPTLCVNALGRRPERIPPELRAKIGGWFRGCDICQEVCPVNRGLVPRQADHRTGYDPERHTSHRYLDNLEKLPRLLPLLGADRPELIRRNDAIVLGNIGRGQDEVLSALEGQARRDRGPLREYYLWAWEENRRRRLPDGATSPTGAADPEGRR